MCGIAGFIATPGQPVPEGLIQRMTDLVAHRGPDGQGVWSQGQVAFGHRRLAIVDLSDLGRQPMEDPASGCVITYNGEIYNHVELRRELIGRGYAFRSQSDTEVILKAYDCWGQACVEHFNGMWAFAIHDPRRRLVFCSRDRFGVKPFYYATPPGGFAFGSEIRQLLPLLGACRANMEVLSGFLAARVAEDPQRSFFEGVHKLPGGHSLVFDLAADRFSVHRHYRLEPRSQFARMGMGDALEAFQELFADAIRLRLRSDVRVGTCLSGGMDSSSIATLAAAEYRKSTEQPFTAVTAVSEDPATDESAYARRVVDDCGLQWIRLTPGYEDFRSVLDQVVIAQEEPFSGASIVMQYFVMREARRAGIPVLLDGQGGDETLLGYERYFADHLLQSIRDMRGSDAWAVIAGLHRNGRAGALKGLMWNLLYFHVPALRRMALRKSQAALLPEFAAASRQDGRARGDDSGMFALQKQEIELTNLPALLRYEDKNSMAHSIETRLPFLDYRLVEFATSVATGVKLHDGWGKFLLRKSMERRMADEIVWRKHKFGFEAPESRWMRQHADSIGTLVRSSPLLGAVLARGADGGPMLEQMNQGLRWRLFSVAAWARAFDVQPGQPIGLA